jgi:hypothetical protein
MGERRESIIKLRMERIKRGFMEMMRRFINKLKIMIIIIKKDFITTPFFITIIFNNFNPPNSRADTTTMRINVKFRRLVLGVISSKNIIVPIAR